MIKLYEGSGMYRITLTSGTELLIHEDDLSEIRDESAEIGRLEEIIGELESDLNTSLDDYDELRSENFELYNDINELKEGLDMLAPTTT